jgi:hypothetical protein
MSSGQSQYSPGRHAQSGPPSSLLALVGFADVPGLSSPAPLELLSLELLSLELLDASVELPASELLEPPEPASLEESPVLVSDDPPELLDSAMLVLPSALVGPPLDDDPLEPSELPGPSSDPTSSAQATGRPADSRSAANRSLEWVMRGASPPKSPSVTASARFQPSA